MAHNHRFKRVTNQRKYHIMLRRACAQCEEMFVPNGRYHRVCDSCRLKQRARLRGPRVVTQ